MSAPRSFLRPCAYLLALGSLHTRPGEANLQTRLTSRLRQTNGFSSAGPTRPRSQPPQRVFGQMDELLAAAAVTAMDISSDFEEDVVLEYETINRGAVDLREL